MNVSEEVTVVTAADDEDEVEVEGLVPYAPDFTPKTLGKTLGEGAVLGFLLEAVGAGRSKARLLTAIELQCLEHVVSTRSRRDMASHVFQGLVNYGLAYESEDGSVVLTDKGRELSSLSGSEQDMAFARHILTACQGYILVETVLRNHVQSGKVPTLEVLAVELDRSATSKNVSTMRAWLARAGVFKPKGYEVDAAMMESLLGKDFKRAVLLSEPQLEFILAARIAQSGQADVLQAADIKLLAETRRPEIKLPAKALSAFVRGLEEAGFVAIEPLARAKGGTRVAFVLRPLALETTDSELRSLLQQTRSRFDLSDLEPISEAVCKLTVGNANQQGHAGEMLAVHACLMLGLTVVDWRRRLPVEIDLIAERSVGLAYQRWHIQVKNTEFDLDADRVDREVGAAAGTGATHLLFIVPRASLSAPARAEIIAKAKLTHLHIFWLTREAFGAVPTVGPMIRELRGQHAFLTRIKRAESERRQKVATI